MIERENARRLNPCRVFSNEEKSSAARLPLSNSSFSAGWLEWRLTFDLSLPVGKVYHGEPSKDSSRWPSASVPVGVLEPLQTLCMGSSYKQHKQLKWVHLLAFFLSVLFVCCIFIVIVGHHYLGWVDLVLFPLSLQPETDFFTVSGWSLHSKLNPWRSAAVCIDSENNVGFSCTNIETGAVVIFMQ